MDEHIDSLIARRLSGECNPAEDAELETWIAASPEHADYYHEMESAWHALDEAIGGPAFDTAAAWERVAPRLHTAPVQTDSAPAKARTLPFRSWIKYATAAAAVLAIALLFLRPEPKEMHIVASNGNQEIRLPDNTLIRLRKGSSLRYPEHFSATERLVHLDGEAFFDVSRREDQHFIVDAGSISVTVLGTSFNVKSGERDADVSVATGRVQLLAKDYDGKKILLRAGRAAHFADGSFAESTAGSGDTAWMSQELVYTTTPLRQILTELAAEADTPVSIDAGVSAVLLGEPVQIRFKASDPLQQRLGVLCTITGLEALKQGKGYLIRMRRP